MMRPLTPLFRPADYFAARDRTAYWTGIGCWVAYFAASLVGTYWFLQTLADRTESVDVDLGAIASDVYPQVVYRLGFSLLIALLVAALAMHYFAAAADTDGTFTDAVGVAGWAFAPLLVAYVIRSGVLIRRLQGQTFDGSDPATFGAEVEAWAVGVEGLGLLALQVLATAWSVYILAFGTAGSHDVALKETGYVAVVIGFVYLAIVVF